MCFCFLWLTFILSIAGSHVTQRVISASDHGAIQLNVAKIGRNGVYTGEYETICISGDVRSHSLSDDAINRIMIKKKIMRDID